MSYSLSFSQDFFLAEGEPYDRSDLALNDDGNPISLYSALLKWAEDKPEGWASMAKDVFGLDEPEYLDIETVLQKVEETDTCSNLSVPVRVWIDSEGDYTVEVYDSSGDN